MSWTDDDVKRLQEKYGDNAQVSMEDAETITVKVDDKKVDRLAFIEGWMKLAAQESATVSTSFTVVITDENVLAVVQAAAEKHGLAVVPMADDTKRYQIIRK